MTERIAVTVERDGPHFVATSPDYPFAGRGQTIRDSLTDLGRQIDASPLSPAGPSLGDQSAESDETACTSPLNEVNSTPSSMQQASDGGGGGMAEKGGVVPLHIETPARRPIPGAMEWLQKHAPEYAGRWVAVGPEGLRAEARTLDDLVAKLGTLQGVLVTRVT
jgi:hypothetical protein